MSRVRPLEDGIVQIERVVRFHEAEEAEVRLH